MHLEFYISTYIDYDHQQFLHIYSPGEFDTLDGRIIEKILGYKQGELKMIAKQWGFNVDPLPPHYNNDFFAIRTIDSSIENIRQIKNFIDDVLIPRAIMKKMEE